MRTSTCERQISRNGLPMMVPALDLLEVHAADLGIKTVQQFYWATGALSSVLDNAPTYLNFLTAAFGLRGVTTGYGF